MENEIKVNEYVRLKDGTIAKVLEIKNQDTDILNWYCLDNDMGTMDRSIVKHSSNLIDLIQCGDYVNGKEVKHIANFEGIEQPIRKVIFVNKTHLIPGETAENEDIETVVTKEQFESISYKVEKM